MIPIKPYDLEYSGRWPKYIMIHNTSELNLTNGSLSIDTNKYQTDILQKNFYQIVNEPNLPYHFLIEKINNDYKVILTRPLLTKIEWLDLDDIYLEAVHVGILGDLNKDIPNDRLYKTLAYYVCAPLMRLFNLTNENIIKHSDVSYDPELVCPGNNFKMSKLKMSINSVIKKKSVVRG